MQTDENIDIELMHITTFPELSSDLEDKSGKKKLYLIVHFEECK